MRLANPWGLSARMSWKARADRFMLELAKLADRAETSALCELSQ